MATTSLQRALGDVDPAYFCIECNAEDELTRVLKDSIEVASFKYGPLGRRVVSLRCVPDGVRRMMESRWCITGSCAWRRISARGPSCLPCR